LNFCVANPPIKKRVAATAIRGILRQSQSLFHLGQTREILGTHPSTGRLDMAMAQ
jgi:hypothetical protein